MVKILVIALCASGCFSDRGVAIEIDVGETGATSVEFFIGKEKCESTNSRCKTITPPNAMCALEASSWFRDDAQRYTAPVNGHTATFRLEANPARTLPIVIAVGLDAGGGAVATATLFDLEVPANTGRIATATLVAAGPVVSTPTDVKNVNQDRVLVWTNKQMPPEACVVVEHWRPGKEPLRDSVVPADDPACNDGVNASIATTSLCATAPDVGEPCVLGIRTCTMDGSVGSSCAPPARPVCIPDQLCPCSDGMCIAMKLLTPTLPHIDCTVPVSLTGGGTCGGKAAEVDLDSELPHGCGHQPQISALPFGGFAQSATFSGVTIQLGTTPESCKFTVNASGSLTGDIENRGVVQLDTKSAVLLLPIQFHFTKLGCTDPNMSCTVTPDSTNKLWSCGE